MSRDLMYKFVIEMYKCLFHEEIQSVMKSFECLVTRVRSTYTSYNS